MWIHTEGQVIGERERQKKEGSEEEAEREGAERREREGEMHEEHTGERILNRLHDGLDAYRITGIWISCRQRPDSRDAKPSRRHVHSLYR